MPVCLVDPFNDLLNVVAIRGISVLLSSDAILHRGLAISDKSAQLILPVLRDTTCVLMASEFVVDIGLLIPDSLQGFLRRCNIIARPSELFLGLLALRLAVLFEPLRFLVDGRLVLFYLLVGSLDLRLCALEVILADGISCK